MSDLARIDWDDIYGMWAYECQQSDTATAEKTGIPRRTIAYHRQVEGWGDRYLDAQLGISEQDLNLAKIEIRALAKEGLQRRLRSIILDQVPVLDPFTGEPRTDEDGQPMLKWRASDKDAVAAMRIVSEYALEPGRYTEVSAPIPASYRVRNPDQELSPAEQAISLVESNVSATNTRIRRGTRR